MADAVKYENAKRNASAVQDLHPHMHKGVTCLDALAIERVLISQISVCEGQALVVRWDPLVVTDDVPHFLDGIARPQHQTQHLTRQGLHEDLNLHLNPNSAFILDAVIRKQPFTFHSDACEVQAHLVGGNACMVADPHVHNCHGLADLNMQVEALPVRRPQADLRGHRGGRGRDGNDNTNKSQPLLDDRKSVNIVYIDVYITIIYTLYIYTIYLLYTYICICIYIYIL